MIPNELNFDILLRAWEQLKKTREDDLRRLASGISDIKALYMKKIAEDESTMTIEFYGFTSAALDPKWIPQIKRAIMTWLQRISDQVRLAPSDPNGLIVYIDKGLKIGNIDVTARKTNPPQTDTNKYESMNRGPNDLARIIAVSGV